MGFCSFECYSGISWLLWWYD